MKVDQEKISFAESWMQHQDKKPFDFQKEVWDAMLSGNNGLLVAPTGSGKTLALMVPIALSFLGKKPRKNKGVHAIWITPLRALSKEILHVANQVIEGFDLPWSAAIRTGDTSSAERSKQKKNPPEFLVTTPESIHVLFSSKDHRKFFRHIDHIVVDEWHELMGSKRGVQTELALAHFKSINPKVKIWGISATMGNLDQAADILMGVTHKQNNFRLVRAHLEKKIEVHSLMPEKADQLPWGGHLGINLIDKILPIILESRSTLLFTNTRAQAEIWYQKILQAEPELAGLIAMHHGSVDRKLRDWVENALHNGLLKVVVCTSSLDLGVDFHPVETVIQVGSPKGVARFMQRAGRSGHKPGAVSRIYFLPTHSLELIEASSLRKAIEQNYVEDRLPYILSFDVLIQYMLTLAVGEGFKSNELFEETKGTYSYSEINDAEWQWCLNFITQGGDSLHAYEEFQKVSVDNGVYKVVNQRIARRHRMSIGTIVSDPVMSIKFLSGGRIGTVEEWFISKLKPGDTFWFAGRNLELFRIKENTVLVKRSKKKNGQVPAWMGGRMPLSANLTEMIRDSLSQLKDGDLKDEESQRLKPLLVLQDKRSVLPGPDEFLIEKLKVRDGYHIFMYPFEGRFVHEGMAALLAWRISQIEPFSFSIAMNDYGFELLADREIPIEKAIEFNLFSSDNLLESINRSMNATELARRKFRDIARIAGLTFQGFPGRIKKDRHIQASSNMFFDVFTDYDEHSLLLKQAYQEVMDFQLEEQRMRKALNRIQSQKIIIRELDKPSPFCFPIMVEGIREKMSTEKLEDRIERMQKQFADL